MTCESEFTFNIDNYLSIIAIIISLIAIYKSVSTSKTAIFKSINTAIDSNRDKLSVLGREMNPLISKRNTKGINKEETERLKSYRKFLNEAYESLFNTYEDACYNYFKRQINKRNFVSMYKGDILKIVREQKFKKYFDKEKSDFEYILKFYKKHTKQKSNILRFLKIKRN